MDGGITQGISNLSKVHMLVPYKLFSGLHFHFCEIIYDTAAVAVPEKLLELGKADKVILADLFCGQMDMNMCIKILNNVIIGFVIIFFLVDFIIGEA